MTKNKRFKRFLLIDTLLWTVIVILFNFFQFRAGIIICALFMLWFFCAKGPIEKFMVLLSGVPFQAITKPTANTPSIAIVLYFAYIVMHLQNTGFRVRRKNILAIVVLVVLNAFALIRYSVSIMNIISGMLSIVFAAAVLEEFDVLDDKISVFEKSAWVFSISMLLDSYSTTIFPELPYYILPEKQTILDRIGRFCALNGDPNYYGQLVTVAVGMMIAMLVLYCRIRKYGLGILCGVVCIALVLNGMTSLSKGYAVGLAGVLFIAVWFWVMEDKPYRQKPLWFLIFMVIGGIAAVLAMDFIILPILAKRTETDIFTGRLNLWKHYITALWNNLDIVFLGAGFANATDALSAQLSLNTVSHNMYLEVLGDLGLVGICTVGILWSSAFGRIRALANNISSLFLWGFLITAASLSVNAFDLIYFCVPLFAITFSKTDYSNARMQSI